MKKLFVIFLLLFLQNSAFAINNDWSQPSSVYVVKKGDTWNSIAKKFEIPSSLLQRYNNSSTKLNLRISERIFIPAKTIYKIKPRETALKIAIANGMTFSELIAINGLKNPDTLKAGDSLKLFNATVKTVIPKKRISSTSSVDDNDLKLAWPVKGKVTSKFGIQPDGSRNNDIHILIEEPQIKAAAPGVVVYTGNEVGSYGNLVIVQHENNWFSSYGNLTDIRVNKGDNVKIEQILGSIKTDDNIQKPELYFGLRMGAVAVNPIKYLKRNNTKSKA